MFDDTAAREFIAASLGECGAMARLSGDASMREYYRAEARGGSFILCYDETLKRTPLASYPFHIVYTLYRKNGIPVPEVIALDLPRGFVLQQDLGDLLLETALRDMPPGGAESAYRKLLDILVSIQSIREKNACLPFTLSFDMEKLMFEFDFFMKHALGAYFGSPLGPRECDDLRAELVRIAGLLVRPEHFVLNHRDYHSRNVMLSGGAPYIIDFQDSRMGLPLYDLVSLLRDSYVTLDRPLADGLADYYYERARDAGVLRMTRGEFDRYFILMAFQRNVKAIGTFGYQCTALGRKLYADYIPPTVRYVRTHVEGCYELKKAGALLARAFGGLW